MRHDMEIKRPYAAEDNPINEEQTELIKRHCSKIGETIITLEIYKYGIAAITNTGRYFTVNITERARSFRNTREYYYMNETINGKQVRIPKSQW